MADGSGRGLGRAGKGLCPKRSPVYEEYVKALKAELGQTDDPAALSASKAATSTSRAALGTSRAVPSASGDAPSTSRAAPSQAGESQPGFPRTSEVEELVLKTPGLKIATPSTASASIGRGGTRGRKQIAVVDVVKTKPDTCLTKQGDAGNRVELYTNYFRVETMADWSLYQYRVDFSVEEEREGVLRAWLRQHKEQLRRAYIFDGTMLFSSYLLTDGQEPLRLTSFRESDNHPVEIEVKLVQKLSYGSSVYLHVFNILVRRCLLHLDLKLVNRNYFDPVASVRMPQHNLEIWPGYVTSIRQHDRGVLLCLEVTHKIMRTDTALKVLYECVRESRDYKKLFRQAMIGSTILTDYNNKTYRVDDIDFSVTPLSTFKYRNETITYVQYYAQRYQLAITDLRQPLLVSRPSARDLRGGRMTLCLLVPELCRMTGLNNRMVENRNLMRDMSEVTRIPPKIRMQRIREFNERLRAQKEIVDDFEEWGLTLGKNMTAVSGRELPPERIIGGKSTIYSSGAEVDWTRAMRTVPMLHNGRLDTLVVIAPSRIKRDLEDFMVLLKRSAEGMQFRIPRPLLIETPTDSPMELMEATERAVCQHHPDLILYGFTSDRADRYSAVKKKCYVDRGVPSQVILARNLRSKGAMSIATKVAIQMNCKIGGAPWTVDIPTENVMVMGFDVCHGKTDSGKSVGAIVASLNRSMSAWYSSVSYHSGREELSNDLPLAVWKALMKYREVNKVLPTRIFFYRDGVGEGQLYHVFEHEVAMIKKKLTELYGGETWKFAFIVVTKRINTRFFASGDRNPRPGTVVDDVVTQPEKYDFFLVSQSVRQGTVTPTSYNVISDNLGWGPNHIQRFTYKMTHLYYNCSVSVRVPAPCQYAHKLAFMVSQNLGCQPHPNLDTRLYYL